MNKERCARCRFSGTFAGYLICDYIGHTGKARTVENGEIVHKIGKCELYKRATLNHILSVQFAKREFYVPPKATEEMRQG